MGSKNRRKKIGILTAGGDCPGLNAAIRGVGKTAIVEYGMKVYGISDGFSGLITKDYFELTENRLSGILTLGGTILGTSRVKPFNKNDSENNSISKPELIKEHYDQMGLDCLVCIGGNGTLKTAYRLSLEGLNIIGVPKTIDNDVYGTDQTFGFDSAVTIATEAIDRLHSTANSHKRIMVIEVMGHHAGWVALYSGMAGGGDVILIPEIPYDDDTVIDYLENRAEQNKDYSIVVVGEGITLPSSKKKGAGHYIAKMIAQRTGLETRETILGYVQRGGTPTASDRILATRYGSSAASLIAEGNYGNMVALKDNNIVPVPLKEVAGKLNLITSDHPLVKKVRSMGTCFGNRGENK